MNTPTPVCPRERRNTMGVTKYVARKKTWWRVDTYVTLPDGTKKRL